jgi:hypothetical protein
MDLRVNHIFDEEMKDDKSFQEKNSLLSIILGRNKYTKRELKETWERGIKHGIEIGLRRGSIEGQRIELTRNTTIQRHIDFIEEFYHLASHHNCAIAYHPEYGMIVIDTDTASWNKHTSLREELKGTKAILVSRTAILQEREKQISEMYTEQEVKDIVWESRKFYHLYKDTPFKHSKVLFIEWFKQFSKLEKFRQSQTNISDNEQSVKKVR